MKKAPTAMKPNPTRMFQVTGSFSQAKEKTTKTDRVITSWMV
jgi:hypothetical protein